MGLKLYDYNGGVYQFEEGEQPTGAKLVKAAGRPANNAADKPANKAAVKPANKPADKADKAAVKPEGDAPGSEPDGGGVEDATDPNASEA